MAQYPIEVQHFDQPASFYDQTCLYNLRTKTVHPCLLLSMSLTGRFLTCMLRTQRGLALLPMTYGFSKSCPWSVYLLYTPHSELTETCPVVLYRTTQSHPYWIYPLVHIQTECLVLFSFHSATVSCETPPLSPQTDATLMLWRCLKPLSQPFHI